MGLECHARYESNPIYQIRCKYMVKTFYLLLLPSEGEILFPSRRALGLVWKAGCHAKKGSIAIQPKKRSITRKNTYSTRKFNIIDLNKYLFNTCFNMAFYILNICQIFNIIWYLISINFFISYLFCFNQNNTFCFRLLFLRDIGHFADMHFFMYFG